MYRESTNIGYTTQITLFCMYTIFSSWKSLKKKCIFRCPRFVESNFGGFSVVWTSMIHSNSTPSQRRNWGGGARRGGRPPLDKLLINTLLKRGEAPPSCLIMEKTCMKLNWKSKTLSTLKWKSLFSACLPVYNFVF